ncbi:hypothetical protein V8Z69_07495 [Microbacterium aurugineum]|uniref:hypothetical protein n=1 Tax=Microbacterium aurugineum TaxID=2851642 RepID=UPI0039BDB47E
MTTTIAHSAGVIVPDLIETFEASREARTVVHDVLNRSNPDITLRTAGLRRGSLSCRFVEEASAQDAYVILAVPQVLSMTNADVPSVAMSFVVAEGDLALSLNKGTGAFWVTIPFVEVAP